MPNWKRMWSYIWKIWKMVSYVKENKMWRKCLDNCLAPCVLTSTDLDWQRHCSIRTNVSSKVNDLLLGRLTHASAIFRATEDTTQIVEGAEASTLVCQHLLGQGFPQAFCVYDIDACELISRLHPLRS